MAFHSNVAVTTQYEGWFIFECNFDMWFKFDLSCAKLLQRCLTVWQELHSKNPSLIMEYLHETIWNNCFTRNSCCQWKRWFHVLYSKIHMAPEKVYIIINEWTISHNIATLLEGPMKDGEVEDEMNVNDVYHGPDEGQAVRNHICRTYFS